MLQDHKVLRVLREPILELKVPKGGKVLKELKELRVVFKVLKVP